MSELDAFLRAVVEDCVEARPAEVSATRVRSCANCGAPCVGWWCSTECRRAEDGDERE